jgi:hypothetical protein
MENELTCKQCGESYTRRGKGENGLCSTCWFDAVYTPEQIAEMKRRLQELPSEYRGLTCRSCHGHGVSVHGTTCVTCCGRGFLRITYPPPITEDDADVPGRTA